MHNINNDCKYSIEPLDFFHSLRNYNQFDDKYRKLLQKDLSLSSNYKQSTHFDFFRRIKVSSNCQKQGINYCFELTTNLYKLCDNSGVIYLEMRNKEFAICNIRFENPNLIDVAQLYLGESLIDTINSQSLSTQKNILHIDDQFLPFDCTSNSFIPIAKILDQYSKIYFKIKLLAQSIINFTYDIYTMNPKFDPQSKIYFKFMMDFKRTQIINVKVSSRKTKIEHIHSLTNCYYISGCIKSSNDQIIKPISCKLKMNNNAILGVPVHTQIFHPKLHQLDQTHFIIPLCQSLDYIHLLNEGLIISSSKGDIIKIEFDNHPEENIDMDLHFITYNSFVVNHDMVYLRYQ